MNERRLARLQEHILAHGLDGLALVPGPNMLYLTGIDSHLSERPIVLFLPVDDDPAIIIPQLEAIKAHDSGFLPDRIFAWSDSEGYTGAFQQACAHLELSDYLLGVEALHMRVLELELLRRYAPGLTTTHAEPILTALRRVKDREEIARMERAVAVAEKAMERLLPTLYIGETEKNIAARLMQELLLAGADKLAFESIVSAGPNGASPHATPTDRPIQAGDLLVIDWGAVVDGYPSDLTRTFAVGRVEDEWERVHELVLQANITAQRVVRPGVTGQDVDRAARQVIAGAGYGDYFIHRTGHGLGIEVHEEPSLVEGNTEPLAPGNVFTIEPGIYLPARGGVRIEDNVLVTPNGHRTLTSFPRELIRVG